MSAHPLLQPLMEAVKTVRDGKGINPASGLCSVSAGGTVHCSPKKRAEPEEWARALSHVLLHLGMDHFRLHGNHALWNTACCCAAESFLSGLKLFEPADSRPVPPASDDEEKLYRRLEAGLDAGGYAGFSATGDGCPDMLTAREQRPAFGAVKTADWRELFAGGLTRAIRGAVAVASGEAESLTGDIPAKSQARRAKEWFISSYPLLGAIAANFTLIEDHDVCWRMEITAAAVSPSLGEIYINPAFRLTDPEMRFVMAHEFLHAALRHDGRREWRDAYLWNVACDFVINSWLTEMGVGERPDGLLHDDQFKGMSAESVYERIVTDMRVHRKLATLRGVGLTDVLEGAPAGNGTDLDGFYRRALSQGLSYHQEQDRGFIPEGLIEEIRALSHPPIPWDVELARWFEESFTPSEKSRSYARPARRQSSTPDIPRPSWSAPSRDAGGNTYGVLIDTSGSMERAVLAMALGAVASYSAAREVNAVRVVFCDAAAYDMGYMTPAGIAGTVKVRGRGGTVLQPGIDFLLNAKDFPGGRAGADHHRRGL